MAKKCIYCGEPIGPERGFPWSSMTLRLCEECKEMELRELELEQLAEECDQYEEEEGKCFFSQGET